MNTTPITITTELLTTDDFRANWLKLTDEKKLESFQTGILRQRYWFNISLFGEGTSYEGQGNIRATIKHIDQPDGFREQAVYASPEMSIIPTAEETYAILCWILGQPLPVGYENGIERIQQLIEAAGGLTLLPPAVAPTPEPTPASTQDPTTKTTK